jgi:hypothetical protein
MTSRAPLTSGWIKAQHPSLVRALNHAWRKHKKDYSVSSITYEGRTIFNNEDLTLAFDRIEELARGRPKSELGHVVEQVIQEMGKSAATGEGKK